MLRVLLVDDSEDSLWLAQAMLRGLTVQIDTAWNGRLALECLARKQYDLVLMDMQMPELNGFEATRAIRDAELARADGKPRLPVIAMSANGREEDRALMAAAGCDGYLRKPLRKEELQGLIRVHARTVVPGLLDGILLEVHARAYVRSRQLELPALAQAIEARDFETIAKIAHKMRGIAGAYGFDELTALGEVLEEAARSQDHAVLADAFSRVRALLGRLSTTAEP